MQFVHVHPMAFRNALPTHPCGTSVPCPRRVNQLQEVVANEHIERDCNELHGFLDNVCAVVDRRAQGVTLKMGQMSRIPEVDTGSHGLLMRTGKLL